ncbi:MAG: type II secretion system protein GspD [Planctomycetota bacterium]
MQSTKLIWVFVLMQMVFSGTLIANPPAPQKKEAEDCTIELLNVKKMKLRDLAKLFSRQSGQKVVASSKAAERKVDIYLKNVSLLEAVRSVCNTSELWYRQREDTGVITIMTLDEYADGAHAGREEIVDIVRLKYIDGKDIGRTLKRLFPDRVAWATPDEGEGDEIGDIERALDRMDTLAEYNREMEEAGGGSHTADDDDHSDDDDNDTDDNDGEADTADVPLPQEIDAEEEMSEKERAVLREILQSDRNHSVRSDIVFMAMLPESKRLLLRSADNEAIEKIRNVIEKLDKPRAQVLLEVKVLDLELDDKEGMGLDWFYKTGDASGGRGTGLNESSIGSDFPNIERPESNLTPEGSGLDRRAVVLDSITKSIRARLQMLSQRDRVTALATPTLSVADNEASRVFVGDEITILKGLDAEQLYNDEGDRTGTDFDPETERRDVGTSLVITPTIHADRTVTIRLAQMESKTGELRDIFTFEEQSFQSTDIEQRSVTSTVVAKDGQISAIGGLIRERTEDERTGIPVLMDIPVLGSLFRTTIQKQKHHELLVLIRPYILLTPDEAENVTTDMLGHLSYHPSARKDLPALEIGKDVWRKEKDSTPPDDERQESAPPEDKTDDDETPVPHHLRQRTRTFSVPPESPGSDEEEDDE